MSPLNIGIACFIFGVIALKGKAGLFLLMYVVAYWLIRFVVFLLNFFRL